MKTKSNPTVLCALVALLWLPVLTVQVFAQQGPSQFKPVRPTELPTVDPAIELAAKGLLEQAQKAFQDAPAITSKVTVVVKSGKNTRDMVINSRFGPDGQLLIEAPDSLVVAKDGFLNVINYDIYDRYLRVQLSGTVSDEFDSTYRDRFMAGFEVLMREGEPLPIWLEALMMRSIGSPSISGLEELVDDKGRTINRISVHGGMGTGFIDYEPETKKIVHASSRMYPLEGVEGFDWTMNLNINSTYLPELPEPIVFDPGKRLGVSSLKEVNPVTRNELVVGKPVPFLTAKTLEGSDVTLSDLKGKIVVLDFWATWCAPCKRGLPKLNEIYSEAGANKDDVVVYAVSIMESPAKAEDKIEKVNEYWKKQDFSVPTLVCTDDEIPKKWGITSIPKIVIIDREGNVVESINGYHEDLKKRIQSKIKSMESS